MLPWQRWLILEERTMIRIKRRVVFGTVLVCAWCYATPAVSRADDDLSQQFKLNWPRTYPRAVPGCPCVTSRCSIIRGPG